MKPDAIAVELTTPSVATMGVDCYTVVRSVAVERIAGRLSHRHVITRIRRLRAREKWIVIGWMREGRALREAFRVGAAEFWWAHNPPAGEAAGALCEAGG